MVSSLPGGLEHALEHVAALAVSAGHGNLTGVAVP